LTKRARRASSWRVFVVESEGVARAERGKAVEEDVDGDLEARLCSDEDIFGGEEGCRLENEDEAEGG